MGDEYIKVEERVVILVELDLRVTEEPRHAAHTFGVPARSRLAGRYHRGMSSQR